MELYNHINPPFTQWAVAKKLLSTPFVVIDIGVQGGEHPRWQWLGPYAEIHGFDAIAEVIDALREAAEGTTNRHYYNIALGNEDGERTFFVSANRFGSSFYSSDTEAEERVVPIRRLDTLFAQGTLPRADYIKLDCEGFEPEILRGAREYLAASDIICVTTETSFHVSPIFPKTHFQAINDIVIEHRLMVFDENPVRAPGFDYSVAIAQRPLPEPDPMNEYPSLLVGRPGTYDIVFCPDLAADRRDPDRFGPGLPSSTPPGIDMVIKSMINLELHGLMDCAVELAVTFRDLLSPRLDVDEAIRLLLLPAPTPRNSGDVALCMQMILNLRKQLLNLEAALANAKVTAQAVEMERPPPVPASSCLGKAIGLVPTPLRHLMPAPMRRALRRFLF